MAVHEYISFHHSHKCFAIGLVIATRTSLNVDLHSSWERDRSTAADPCSQSVRTGKTQERWSLLGLQSLKSAMSGVHEAPGAFDNVCHILTP